MAVSLEPSKASWKVALHNGKRNQPAVHTVKGEHPRQRLGQAVAVIEAAKKKWGLPEGARVMVSYEAGQDGFWIQRALEQQGYEAVVIDPASIPVERHARRAKTDRLDAIKLVVSLLAWLRGTRTACMWCGCRRKRTKRSAIWCVSAGYCKRKCSSIATVCASCCALWAAGTVSTVTLRNGSRTVKCCHNDSVLSAPLQSRLLSECERLAPVEKQLQELEATMAEVLPQAARSDIAKLTKLKGLGTAGGIRIRLEFFWREFTHRRQIGSCMGVVSQPYDSGESRVDQGISKQGNRRVRALAIEMAWMWLRYQPESKLSKWFAQRTQGSGKRGRRIAIVAVARRLVIALWRYLKDGVVPEGAVLKTA
jgi:transposase